MPSAAVIVGKFILIDVKISVSPLAVILIKKL